MKSYRFLLLDADHTLLDFDYDMYVAFERMYKEAGLQTQKAYTKEIHDIYEACNNVWWHRFEQRACTKQALYHGRFQDFLQQTGLSYDPVKLNHLYFKKLAQTGTAYAGAATLMRCLSAHYECDIITNGNASSQPGRLKNSGLAPYYNTIFVSETVGVGKPDRRYFQYVFQQIPDFDPDKALVIGDSLSSDIQGAVNAGIDSLWYNPKRLPRPLAPACTYEAADYLEILSLLLPTTKPQEKYKLSNS